MTCCDILSGVVCKPGARQLTDFSVLPWGVQALKGIARGTKRDRGVAGLRDRPFILKGLFTMVISAWGTGYSARYQGIKARFVQQAYFLVGLELHYFSFLCVRNVLKWKSWGTLSMPLLKEEAGLVSASTVVLFFFVVVAERNLLCWVCFVSEILFQDPCSPSCWCVYHMYSSVCWDLLSPHFPPIRDRGNLEL